MVTWVPGREPDTPPATPTVIDVVAAGAVDGDRVGLTVAGACCRARPRGRSSHAGGSVPLRSFTTMSAPPRALKSMRSTRSMSIVTLATSRKKGSAAVGRDVDVLGDAGAVEFVAYRCPAWPSTASLSSPGFQMNLSSPAPREGRVVALAAEYDNFVALGCRSGRRHPGRR